MNSEAKHCLSIRFGPLVASNDYSTLLLLNDRKVADVDIGSKKNGHLSYAELTHYGFFSTCN